MKNFFVKFLIFAGIFGLVAFSAIAQDKPDGKVISAAGDKYVISAKAGGINYIEGKVFVERKSGKSGVLLKGDTLEIGDKVSTAADGRVEILLNPGSYLRLAGNSEFEFKDTDLDNLTLILKRGSGIFEVYASEDYEITVETTKNKIYLIESGVFRLDISGDTETLSVWKGKARIGDGFVNVVKEGGKAVITDKDFAINKFDRDNGDAFDNWSKLRSKELARINKELQEDLMRSALLDSYRRQGWGFYESFGLWVYDWRTGTFCFLPFSRGWRSPYGFRFGYNIWNYNYPWSYHPTVNPPINPPVNPPNTGPTQAQIREQRRLDLQTPPFQRINQGSNRGGESSGGGSSGGGGSFGGGKNRDTNSGGFNSSSDTKVFSPSPPPSAPPVSSPPIIVNTSSSDDTKGKP